MEWIKTILAKHLKEDGTLDLEAANKEIDAEFPKNAVPKEDFNSKVNELKTANDTINTLQADNKDVEKLQTEITDYKTKVAQLEADQEATATRSSLEKSLRDAGAKDIDYLIFKIGEIEKAEDGSIKDLDNKIKDLQTNYANQFETGGEDIGGGSGKGFTLLGDGMRDGKTPNSYTRDEIAQMSTEQINENWDAVKASLENGGN